RDILDVDEVGPPAPPNLERASGHGGLDGERRIGGDAEVAPGPVDGEGAKAHRGQPVLRPVDPRGLLVGDLVDAVVRRRESGRVVFDRAGRVEVGRAEDGGGGGVDDTLHPNLAGSRRLEDVCSTDDVDQGAPRRVLAAERDLPGREMDDAADRVVAHDADQGVAVRDVAPHARDPARDVVPRDHPRPPRVVPDVEDDGTLTRRQEPAHDPRADAAERAGHQGRHEPKNITCGTEPGRAWLATHDWRRARGPRYNITGARLASGHPRSRPPSDRKSTRLNS